MTVEKKLNLKVQFKKNLFENNYQLALKYGIKLADLGSSEVYYFLGAIYESGDINGGVDSEKAEYWFNKSVVAIDDFKSKLGIVRIKLCRCESEEDFDDAHEYLDGLNNEFENDKNLLFGLGGLFMQRAWSKYDVGKAVKYFRKSSELGHHKATCLYYRCKMDHSSFLYYLPYLFWSLFVTVYVVIKGLDDRIGM